MGGRLDITNDQQNEQQQGRIYLDAIHHGQHRLASTFRLVTDVRHSSQSDPEKNAAHRLRSVAFQKDKIVISRAGHGFSDSESGPLPSP